MNNRPARFSIAVGLNYDPNSDFIPSISLKTQSIGADEIVKLAKRFSIPIKEDGALASLLLGVEVDDPIPPKLYRAVAVLLNEIDRQLAHNNKSGTF